MSYNELNFDRQNISFAMSEVKDMFLVHFGRGCQYVIKGVLEKLISIDFESYMKAERYRRVPERQDLRNGYRRRSLLTTVGVFELKVPRSRQGGWQLEVLMGSRVSASYVSTVTKDLDRLVIEYINRPI